MYVMYKTLTLTVLEHEVCMSLLNCGKGYNSNTELHILLSAKLQRKIKVLIGV